MKKRLKIRFFFFKNVTFFENGDFLKFFEKKSFKKLCFFTFFFVGKQNLKFFEIFFCFLRNKCNTLQSARAEPLAEETGCVSVEEGPLEVCEFKLPLGNPSGDGKVISSEDADGNAITPVLADRIASKRLEI